MSERIFISLGSNEPSAEGEPPAVVSRRAVHQLPACGVEVVRCSSFWRSAPLGVEAGSHPWYVNAVLEVAWDGGAEDLLAALQALESEFGRPGGRSRADTRVPRVLDLDILDFRGQVFSLGEHLIVPHPEMALRSFVLLPLAEIAPDWRHPISGLAAGALLEALSEEAIPPVRLA